MSCENVRTRVAWATALVSTLLALALRLAVDPLLGSKLPFVSFFLAVTVTAYFANTSATLLSIVLGYFAANWFFIEPRHTLLPVTFAGINLVTGIIYLVVTGCIASMSHLMSRSRSRALATAEELALRRQSLHQAEERLRLAHELSLDGFTVLDAVRDANGTIVDFRWSYVNPIAGKLMKHAPEHLVGQRLLDVLPGNRDASELFERYVRVVETGEAHDCEILYRSEGIDGWFRNMAVRVGDGIAVSFCDITERVNAEAATAKANALLRESDRRKDEFLAMLSHELRNPLAAMSTSLQVLERAEPRSGPALRAQAVIGRQLGQLTHLVEDLLEVTRITRNRIQLQCERVELNALVEHTVDDCRHEFERASVRLELETYGSPVPVAADPARMVQILGNLLNNAAKFTPAGGQTTVSVRADPARNRASVCISDTGMGMAADLLPHIFQPFMQADTSLSRSKGGLGLGLALVKGLVELHGGEVSASSEGLGCGSRFTVTLPLAPETVCCPEPEPARTLAAPALPLPAQAEP